MQYLGVVAGLISLLTAYPYIRDVLAGKTKPQRATWLVWMTLNLVFIATQIAEGASFSIISLVINTIVGVYILYLSINYGVGGVERRDRLSLLAAAIGIVVWFLTSNPTLTLMITLLVDFSGSWLTLLKTYKTPWSETLIFWVAGIFTGSLSALSVNEFELAQLAFPLYLFFFSLTMTLIMYFRRKTIPDPSLN